MKLLRKENAPIMSFGHFTMIIKVSINPHKDVKIPNIERSLYLLMIPSEIRVVPIEGTKLLRGSGIAIDIAQSSIIRAKIFSPGS